MDKRDLSISRNYRILSDLNVIGNQSPFLRQLFHISVAVLRDRLCQDSLTQFLQSHGIILDDSSLASVQELLAHNHESVRLVIDKRFHDDDDYSYVSRWRPEEDWDDGWDGEVGWDGDEESYDDLSERSHDDVDNDETVHPLFFSASWLFATPNSGNATLQILSLQTEMAMTHENMQCPVCETRTTKSPLSDGQYQIVRTVADTSPHSLFGVSSAHVDSDVCRCWDAILLALCHDQSNDVPTWKTPLF